MYFETLDVKVENGLASLVMDNPDAGNPMGETFCREFGQAAAELAKRSDVRAILLSSRGRFFSVGGDVGLFLRDLDAAPQEVLNGTYNLHMGLTRLLRMDAPLVGCVHAAAAGGAVSLISHCDIVYASRSSRFTAAYTRLGFTPDLGATFGLASRMGPARAKRFLLMDESLDADEALSTGLVDYVVDDDEVLERATATAESLRQGPTVAFGHIRRLVARSPTTHLETQLEDEAQCLAHAASTADAREGIAAFTERRPPSFVGR